LPRVTSLPYGRWTYVVPANGTYTVRASKAGYVTQDVSVPVANVPVGVSIDLQPETPPPGGCVSADVPATSTYGLVAMTAAIIVAAGILVRRSGYQA